MIPSVKRAILLLISLYLSNPLIGFQKSDIEIDSLVNQAIQEYKTGLSFGRKTMHDSIFTYFENAKNTFKKYEKKELYIKTLAFESSVYQAHGKYIKTIELLKECYELAKKDLKTNNHLTVKILRTLGSNYYRINDYDNSEKCFLEGLKYYDIIGDHQEFAFIYNNLAGLYLTYFDTDKALDFIEKAFILKKKLGLKGRTIGKYYQTKGNIYYETRNYYESIELYKNALNIFLEIDDFKSALNCYAYLGELSRRIVDYKSAFNYLEEGLNLSFKHIKKPGINHATVRLLLRKAEVFADQGNLKKGYDQFFKAHQLAKNKSNSWFNYHYGDHLQKMNLLDSALARYQTGIINIMYDFKETDVHTNPEITNSKDDARLLQLLLSKAKTLYKKYQSAPNEHIKDLNFAFETNLLAEELINKILNSYQSAGSQLAWSQFMLNAYEQSITTSLALYQETQDENFLTTAFNISEKSKASTLINGIRTSEAKKFAGIPEGILQKEKELKIKLSYNQSQLLREQYRKKVKDSSNIFNIKEKIFALNREQEDFTLQLEKQYPKYYKFKYDQKKINIPELQNSLKENTTLVEYFIGDSSIYVFTVDQKGLDVKQINKIDSLSIKVQGIQQALRKSDFKLYAELSNKLYQQLIQPLSLNKNLIIIPDGPLWYLNFDILLIQKPLKKDFKSCQYLIKDHNISYAYSAGLLMNDSKNYNTSENNDCLAFSYNNEDENEVGDYIAMRGFRNSKRDLPGSRKEISAISNVIEGAYYFGAFANEKNFKDEAKNYGILHLALHGEINDQQPMNSRLLFTQDKDSLEDNFLHAYELYNTELNAELAVLSACNTGSGRLVKGEGIMSMGRAFTYAGVKSLVLSQWELSDEFTPNLMENFYKNLKDGQTKSEALRNAKLDYLETADNLSANPYYWAPLVQLGNNSPLPKKSIYVWLMMGVVIVSVVVSTYSILKRNKRS